MTVVYSVIMSILECTAIVFLVVTFSRGEIKPEKMIVLGTITMAITRFSRRVGVPFGVHTIIGITFVCITIALMTKTHVLKTFLASALTYAALILSETLSTLGAIHLFNLSVNEIMTNLSLKATLGIPHVLTLYLLGFAFSRMSLHKTPKPTFGQYESNN